MDLFVPHAAHCTALPLVLISSLNPPFTASLCCVQIMKEILEHKIKIYEFPETDEEEEMKIVRKIKVCCSKQTHFGISLMHKISV